MAIRISSLDLGYSIGGLSAHPVGIDSLQALYETRNNAETTLRQTLSFNGKYIIVNDSSKFPPQGLLRIGPPAGKAGNYEIIYFAQNNNNVLSDLVRGFAGSRQSTWKVGSHVIHSVMAEHHNALRDAIYNMQVNLGVSENPTSTSLNGILKRQENIFLAPKAIFRAHKISGPPPFTVRFQNFSTGPIIRYLWDFGDGTTSIEKSPIHTYLNEGIYTVQLNLVTVLGGQGISTKSNYITVSEQEITPFFYVTPSVGITKETALKTATTPTTFRFIDQTDGDISQRYWIFGGNGTIDNVPVVNQSYQEDNPNIHEVNFVFDKPNSYTPGLMIVFENANSKRAFLSENIVVT
jgi:PKD repeat protein